MGQMPDLVVTVLAHARVPSPERADTLTLGSVEAVPLREALTRTWSTDAHVTAYEPVELPCEGAPGGYLPVRLTRAAILEGVPVDMQLLIGDVDPPGHVATDAWRVDVEARLRASNLAWYPTRNGYRVIARLPEPIRIANEADEREWYEIYLGWCEGMRERWGLTLDAACKDWTRIYRLPRVARKGGRSDATVERLGRIPTLDIDGGDWLPPAAPAAPPKATRPEGEAAPTASSAALERAIATAQRVPASVEGHGGDAALFVAANEIAAHLGEDREAIEAVLREEFNPRCLPPWDAGKIAREATRAAERHATPEARYGERAAARAEARAAAEAAAFRPAGEGGGDPWERPLGWSDVEEPIEYYCEGLRLAPSDGKISIIAGQPGAGKGPIADHVAVAFALGMPVFGVHACTRRRVGILDWEGPRLTRRRCGRMARAMGRAPSDLDGRLDLLDGNSLGNFADASTIARLRQWIDTRGIEVLVVDSYMSAMLQSGFDPNQPQYACLAQALGALGILVIAVAHSSKAHAKENREPRLSDIAYTGAFAALAQTAIVAWYPDPEDRYTVRLACARAPEESFPPLTVRFEGAKTEPLHVRVVTDAGAMVDAARPAPAARGVASDVPPGGAARVRRTLAATSAGADRLEALLGRLDPRGGGIRVGKLRDALGLSGARWGDVRAEVLRRGTVEETGLPSDRTVSYRLRASDGPDVTPADEWRPQPGEIASRARPRSAARRVQ